MQAHEIEALSKWEIKDLDAKQAIDWLISVNVISGHTALFGLAYFIHCQQQRESDLQQRLRELDEKNQTQATVLAARDKIIQQQMTIQHAYRDEMAALKKDLAAARRCGSCRHWDEKAHRCCNSNSQLFSVLSVLRYETCDGWDNLQNLYNQRDGE